MTSNDYTAGLANLRATLKRTRKTLKPPPMMHAPAAVEDIMLANLRTQLRIARKAFKSDRAYRRAFLAEQERQWNRICHLDHLAIDAVIHAKQKLRRRRSGPGRR